MKRIATEEEYLSIMKRIDHLYFETNANTPSDDPRLKELDSLSSLIEDYEKAHIMHLSNESNEVAELD